MTGLWLVAAALLLAAGLLLLTLAHRRHRAGAESNAEPQTPAAEGVDTEPRGEQLFTPVVAPAPKPGLFGRLVDPPHHQDTP